MTIAVHSATALLFDLQCASG